MTRRRQLLVGGIAIAAVGAGVGWALRRQSTGPAARKADAPPDLWSLRFENPSGGEIVLAGMRGRPLLLNFWATWCAPCVEELPMLDRFVREHAAAGWQVLGLAIDSVAPVREFLGRHPVGFPIGLAGAQGVTLSRSLGNTHGSLPFSVVFDSRGEAVQRKLGSLVWDDLRSWSGQIR
jgi:thiol-disulfide isomerase/thioredoxin